MKIDNITTPRGPRSWIVLDIESAVLDDTAHKRYQQMERWVPSDDKPIRRGYQRSEDPLTCPRWCFQAITTAAMMVLVEDPQGGIDVARFVTLSTPDHSEREVLTGILQVLADAPADAELCTWMGLAGANFSSVRLAEAVWAAPVAAIVRTRRAGRCRPTPPPGCWSEIADRAASWCP